VNTYRATISAVVLTFFAVAAQAMPLAPASAMLAPGEPDPVGGVVLATTGPVPFVGLSFSGTLTSTVILGDPSNPFGGLTFTYLLSNALLSTDSIGRLTVNGWDMLPTDASYQIPAAGLPPTTVDRSVNANVIGFNFIPPVLGFGALMPGMASALLVVQTPGAIYTTSFASVIDGTVVSPIPTFAPIPEPTTVALVVFGLLGTLALCRRR